MLWKKGTDLPSPRPGFGYEKSKLLFVELEKYKESGLDYSKYAFVESICVFRAYYSFTDNDIEKSKKRFFDVSAGVEFLHASVDHVSDICKVYDNIDTSQIESFISLRHSISIYEQRPIEDAIIPRIIKITSEAPSACNRQPVKVYISTNLKTVEKNQLIPENKGLKKKFLIGRLSQWTETCLMMVS